jgi:hypothetical protein
MNACIRRTSLAVLIALCLALGVQAAEPPQAGAPALSDPLDTTTPWRVHCMSGPIPERAKGDLTFRGRSGFTPPPPDDWIQPPFDDSRWGRLQEELVDITGSDRAFTHMDHLTQSTAFRLSLRTRFGVADPAKVKSLRLSIAYRGGVVVYVNGQEAGRGHIPPGAVGPQTVAEDYPSEAYVAEDGNPLPPPNPQDPKLKPFADRYAKRERRLDLDIPAGLLVKGGNVLAIALWRAARNGPVPRQGSFSHLGIQEIRLSSADGEGVIPYAEATSGLRLWNANPMDSVAEYRATKAYTFYGWFIFPPPMRGITVGNPFDPLVPVRMVAARNGTCSGQVVLSDCAGLKDVTAQVTPLRGPGGATIPPAAIAVRYAWQEEGVVFCDGLRAEPKPGATTRPVWLLVEVPKTTPPGWYSGSLRLTANGQARQVPVQILVCGFVLPDPAEYQTFASIMHSADSVALKYNVEPWSDRHFNLLEKSFELMGSLGNDTIFVPIVLQTYKTGLIRWVKEEGGYRPDLSAFEKYLELYLKHNAPPKAIVLAVWEPKFAGDKIVSHGDTFAFTGEGKAPFLVTGWDPKGGRMEPIRAPQFGEEGSEAFWKPMFDGVLEIVRKRGWSEKAILLGEAFDARPPVKRVEFARRLAPYARWQVASHFTSGGKLVDGALVVADDIEVGLKESVGMALTPALFPERPELRSLQFHQAFLYRETVGQWSSPATYRVWAALGCGNFTRWALDFWQIGAESATSQRNALPRPGDSRVVAGIPCCLTVPGPAGALPTVRYRMIREALQETEARIAIKQALYKACPEAFSPKRKPEERSEMEKKCLAVLRDYDYRYQTALHVSQSDLSLDWFRSVAQTYNLAGELTGATTPAAWDQPPK